MIQANGQAAQRFLGPPRTADYKPSLVAPLPLWSGHDTTWYSWYDVEWMRRDPQCQFGLRILRAPLATVTWEIPASAPEVAAWVDRTLRKVWTRYLNKVTAYLEYGSCGGEVTWRYDRGSDLIELDELLDLHVLDMKPLQQSRKQVGIRVKSSLGDMAPADLFAPRYWWIANESEFGAYHGRARLSGAWIPWQEKTARHGARDVRRTWYVKNVMDGGTLYVPPGTTEVDIGVNKANVDYGRELMEKSLAGGVKVFPNVTDEKGKRLWEYEAPKINGELTGIHTLMEELDVEIVVGMGIPPEVVQAADTGSGWSGRSVPFLVFLTSEDQLADTTVQAIDRHILRPGVAVNFGEDARYEIRLKSLVKQAEEEEAKKQGQAPGAKPGETAAQGQEQKAGPPQGQGQGQTPSRPQGAVRMSQDALAGGADIDPRVRIRPDGWPEMLDPETMQWLAGDEIDLPEDGEDAPPPAVRMSVQHAPAGYTKESPLRIGGKEFTGGEFIPDDVLARATPEEKAQLAGKSDAQEKRRQRGRERRAKKRAEKEEAQRRKLQSAPTVANRDLTAEPTREFLDKFFPGQKLSVDDVPSMVGAPGGAEVHVYAGTYGGESISIGMYHPYIQQCSRMLHLDRDGKLVMHNMMFFLKKAHRGSGLGLQVFSEEVRKCAELGVDRIETIAGKGGIMNGYYTWARLGYDSPLEERFQKRLPENLQGASTVQDLMATPEGREYWKAKGYMTGMQFDLAPGSRSLQVLNAYLVSKNKQPIAVSPEQMEKVRKARQVKAAREAEEREKSRRQHETALNAVNVEWKGVAEKDGLDSGRLLERADSWERRMLANQTNHPANIFGATDPVNIRENAYRNAHLDMLMERHRRRMESDEPAYVQTRKHYERLAKQEGIDLKRLRELVLHTPNHSPDGVYALGAAYRRCIKELREE